MSATATAKGVKYPDVHRRFIAARVHMLLAEPFFGPLALRLQVKEDLTCQTAWVDGVTLGYNPDFVRPLSRNALTALIVHEVMHCAAGHPWRRGGRDPRRWNEACDRVINPMLTGSGYTLPDGALDALDPSHLGKSAEWVYDRLPASPPGNQGTGSGQGAKGGPGQPGPDNDPNRPPAGGQGSEGGNTSQAPTSGRTGQPAANEQVSHCDTSAKGGSSDHKSDELGEVRDAPTSSNDGEAAPTEEDWSRAVQQAASMAKAQGKLPAGMARWAEAATAPRVDWRAALRRFAQEWVRSDYSYARPNPRFVASGCILPSLRQQELGILAVAVDTSGSIDQVLLQQFAAELQAIADEVHPAEVRVLYADARVHRTDTFLRGDPITLNAKGGGGTDFRPVFAAINEWDTPPAAVVYLTDLHGTFPQDAPDCPTLWVTAAAANLRIPTPPFGEVVVAGA